MKIVCQNCGALVDLVGQATPCERCEAINMIEDYPAYGDLATIVAGAMEEFREQLTLLDDDSLIDELEEFYSSSDFHRDVDKAYAYYYENGKLTRKHRKLLEACYVLLHSGGFLE